MADNIIKGHSLGEYYKKYGSLLKKGRLLVIDSKNPNDMELLSKKRRYWEIKTGGRTKYYEAPNRFITALRTPAYSLKRAKPATKVIFACLCVGAVAAIVVPTTLHFYANRNILHLGDKIIAPDSINLIEVDNTTVVIGEDYHAIVTVKVERAEISTLSVYIGEDYLTYDIDYLYTPIGEANGNYKKYDLVVYKEAITGPIELSVELTGLPLSRSSAIKLVTSKYVSEKAPAMNPTATTFYYDFGSEDNMKLRLTNELLKRLSSRGSPSYNNLSYLLKKNPVKQKEITLTENKFYKDYGVPFFQFYGTNINDDRRLNLWSKTTEGAEKNFENNFRNGEGGVDYIFRELDGNLEVKRTINLEKYMKVSLGKITGKFVDIIRYNDDGVLDYVYSTFSNVTITAPEGSYKLTFEISFYDFNYNNER